MYGSVSAVTRRPVVIDSSGLGKTINYRAVQLPSMSKVCPVMSDAAGEERKTRAPTTSMGAPIR